MGRRLALTAALVSLGVSACAAPSGESSAPSDPEPVRPNEHAESEPEPDPQPDPADPKLAYLGPYALKTGSDLALVLNKFEAKELSEDDAFRILAHPDVDSKDFGFVSSGSTYQSVGGDKIVASIDADKPVIAALAQDLRAMGVEVSSVHERWNSIIVNATIAQLLEIIRRDDVNHVTLPLPGVTQ